MADGCRKELERMLMDPSRKVSKVYIAAAFHAQGIPADVFPRGFVARSLVGPDVFYLVYQTNAPPIFSVWHANPFAGATTNSSPLKRGESDRH